MAHPKSTKSGWAGILVSIVLNSILLLLGLSLDGFEWGFVLPVYQLGWLYVLADHYGLDVHISGEVFPVLRPLGWLLVVLSTLLTLLFYYWIGVIVGRLLGKKHAKP